LLLRNGAQIETRNIIGCTPLFIAAFNGQTNVVRALVSAGADANTTAYNDVSVLNIASEKG